MRAMLEAEPDLAVVGEAGDGREAVDDTAFFAGSATRISASLISGFAQRLGTNPLQGVAMVGVENLTGSGLNDVLEGSSAANKLVDGGKGTDTCTTDRAEKLITRCE